MAEEFVVVLQGTQLEIECTRNHATRRTGRGRRDDQRLPQRRVLRIGLKEEYPRTTRPFPWMSEIMDLEKQKIFFETWVVEYQTGGALSWD
jgi:ribonucleoside-diphosphate reductase beta chain